ncbi:hypothetical protein [Bacteroides sp. 519]|uniref:hypothetical protein n=1 Tax=Bacteroides sp. 519 TaxID=2302937 RepID=UPI0013D8BE0E|nr:hypothetical protein [Bacteroides sp. 519]NDV59332.1 hypothetical protein [Bacteroides sp. 519]
MKKLFLAVSLLTAIGMTGCSDSSNDILTGKEDNVLIVRLPDNVKYTRSVEDPVSSSTSGAQTGIDDVTVFLLTGQVVERSVEFDANDLIQKSKRIEQVPAQVNRVIVVANKVGNTITDLATENDIKNFAYTVESQHRKTQLNGKTLMGEGIPADKPNTNGDGHLYKEATVSLKAITARIEVGTVVPGEGVESVELVAVYINNFYETYMGATPRLYPEGHAIWGLTVANDPGANIGSVTPVGTITPNAYTPVEYMNLGSSEVVKADNSKAYAFHVFPGNVPHLVLLVKVVLKEKYYEIDANDNHLKYKYGFLTYTKFKEDAGYIQAMEGHNVYKMGVGNKGIPVNAKDITDKPEKGPYDLGINIQVANWTSHEVTPEV